MVASYAVGDDVQTPFGKGVVREVRTGGRLLVDIVGRRVVVDAAAVRSVDAPRKRPRRGQRDPLIAPAPEGDAGETYRTPAEVDLHGLYVADALVRVESAINDALLAGRLHLRIIHGRGGGRIKSAVHHQLRDLPPVRSFRLDPLNLGVTLVEL